MPARRALALLAVLLAALAGCAGGAGGDGAPASPLDGLDDVEPAQEGKGAVAGVVVDESIRPIAGASVSMAGAVVAETDEGGIFILDALEPGLAIFAVTAPGFLPVQTSADVQPGATSQVRVQMPRDTRPVPYKVTYRHDGFIEAWGGYAQYYVENIQPSGTCDCRLYFTPEPNATTIVYEAYWEANTPDPAAQAEYYWVIDQPDGDGHEAGYCFSPCVEHVSFDGFSDGVEAYARLDGPDFWLAAQQSFQLFVTVWYNGAAPADWTLASEGP
ncbi:MAG: Carboxypeptidase regulatory-like domain [Thermoplasmata archaeon]|jgi:hypothetical protein|nr:Carboxypeptidase regulatory-like domain [Thermoplasmata archaeon]